LYGQQGQRVTPKLVSFIIPAFNSKAFVREAVDSCLGQTYPDVEVVVTDDGSSDGTLQLLHSAYDGNPRVRVFSFDRNRGKVAAYNQCYKHAEGEFIAVLDADDVSLEDRVKHSLEGLKRHNAEMVCGDALAFGDAVRSFSVAHEWFGLDQCVELDFESLLKRPKVLGPTVFCTREVCEAIFPIDERMSHQDWWMPLAAAYRRPVRHLPTPLIKYRLHSANTSRVNPSQTFERWLEISTREIFYYEKVLESFDLSREQKDFCRMRIRLFELLKEPRPFRRWAAGFGDLGLAMSPGVPSRERAKYLLAMASPRFSYRISMAAARRNRRG
jgi:glycosyltransferase involved in cell wall biosynthesis